MLSFPPGGWMFAAAGLIAAAGPVIIHLLNRRRFKVVNWAAMDFLLAAVQRNRRVLQLRDLLLLALRTACLILLGLALARPFFSSGATGGASNQPVHALIVLDNSLSMGVQQLSGTLLDEAKAKAIDFVGQLPTGSQMSVLPLCGSPNGFSREPYRSNDDAIEAIRGVELVDRAGTASMAADLARESLQSSGDTTKRLVFLGDQQRRNWPAESLANQLTELPEMQVAAIGSQDTENSWVAEFRVPDGLGDSETPTTFSGVIRHEGPQPRPNVQVTLQVDGVEVASEVVDLEPGQAREVTFQHRFDSPAEPGKPLYAAAELRISPDRLPEDDARFLAAPVAAAVKAVFVDQFGSDEAPAKNRLGETRLLRKLLAPTAGKEKTRSLVSVEHVRIDQVNKELLSDARLVVIAGVASPEGAVATLREYVEQGGQLLIAAGADFDPAAWYEAGWSQGRGVLPLPLKPQPIGRLPDEAGEPLRPFQLDVKSLSEDYFHLSGADEEEATDLYQLPFFFKAIEVDESPTVLQELQAAAEKTLGGRRESLTALEALLKKSAQAEAEGRLDEDGMKARDEALAQQAELQPAWLSWRADAPAGPLPEVKDVAAKEQPRVLARFDNKAPFLIERRLGSGRIVFAASGMLSKWNTLPRTNAMLMFDRLLRSMLESTFTPHTLSTVDQLVLPVIDRAATYVLQSPDGAEESLTVDALGPESYGVAVRDLPRRGFYRVFARKPDASADPAAKGGALWTAVYAVNGPAGESDLTVLNAVSLKERMGDAKLTWVDRDSPIRVEGGEVYGQSLWKWLLGLMLLCLLVEMAVLARPQAASPAPAPAAGSFARTAAGREAAV